MGKALRLFAVLLFSVACHAQIMQQVVMSGAPATGAGNFTLVQTAPSSVGCSGSTTCSIALPSSLGSGHLVAIQCYMTSPVSVTSVNAGGTLVPVFSTNSGNNESLWSAGGYIYPSTSTAGPIVVTATGSIGSGSTCVLREYSVSSGAPVLDWAHASFKAGTTSVTGETPAYSGTNDLVVQSNNTNYQITTAVSGYTDGKFDAANGPGWADQLNTTSTTAPTWTVASGSGSAATNGMAFATNATPCTDELFVDWSGSTSGTVATAALANSSSFGMTIAGASFSQGFGWGVSNDPMTAMTYQSASPPALHTPVRICGDGLTHSGSTSFTMQYNFATPVVEYLHYGIPNPSPVTSYGEFINTTYPGSDTQNHDVSGVGSTLNNFVTLQVVGNSGSPALQIECNGGSGTTNFSSPVNISGSTWYWVTIQNNPSTGGRFSVYSTSTWSSIGSGVCTASGWNTNAADTFQVGQGGGTGDFPSAVIQHANVRLNPSGVYPLVP